MASQSHDRIVGKNKMLNDTVPRSVFYLSFSGLIPFVGLAFFLVTDTFVDTALSRQLLVAYAIAIASFLGGVEWGAVMRKVTPEATGLWRYFALSVVPPLAAWATFLIPARFQFFWLGIVFGMLFVIDYQFLKRGTFESWYLKIRWPLSLIVIICLSVAGINDNL